MITAADIEAAGKRLVIGRGDRLTPLARDLVKELGIELIVSDGADAATTAKATTEGSAPGKSTSEGSMAGSAAATAAAPIARESAAQTPGPPVPASSAGASASTARTPFVLPPSGALYRRSAQGPRNASDRTTKRPKAGVVGAGHVGAMTALRLAESDLFSEVVLVDVVPGLAPGLALDMWHGAGLYGFSTRMSGSDNLDALAGAAYIVVTAGKPRQPGMSRTDLTAVNAAIMKSVAEGIRAHAPEATLVVVSNPLEEMTYLAREFSGFPDERVLGMAGVLDSARFCSLVGLTGRARPQDVRALALGSHGPEMVIPLSQAYIGDTPVEAVLDARTLAEIVERTRESGGEVVKLLQKGSAYFSPAESSAAMVRAMVADNGEVLAACVRSRGAYGVADTRVGLPVRLGRRGVAEIVTLPLRPEEQQALREAAARIESRIRELPRPQ